MDAGALHKPSTTENNATKTAVLEKISELLTDELPAPKAGGSFEIVISKDAKGIKATCKAYEGTTPEEGEELKAQS